MSLSSDLISQFVKVTNDKTEAKKETTVYGTTVKYNDNIYVKIDGSEILTPISSTADAEENERVTVMIKNHTATITGNLSSPAARSDDVKYISDDIKVRIQAAENAATSAGNTAADAAKVATNYLQYGSSGLIVGDMTVNKLGKNVLIDSDSVDIRNGNTVLSSFGASEIILGQNAEDSVINLCDGAATINTITSGATTSYPHYDGINIASEEIEMSSSQFRVDTTSGSSFVNSGEIRLVNQSSSAGSTSSFNSECKIASSGSRLSTGLLSSATSSASTTCTDIYASHYNASSGTTNSNYVSVYPTHTQMSKPITINSIYITAINKHLWSGANYMNAAQSITLSEAVSAQVNGIVLVWSYYESGAAKDFNFQCHFVPKWLVKNYAGKGSDYALANHTGNVLGHKYLYISDTTITGNDYNDDGTVAGSRATYTNTAFVLRAVIGV